MSNLSRSHPHITAFTLHPLLTSNECRSLIAYTESKGYIPALLNNGTGAEKYAPNIRKSSRCIIDSCELSTQIWSRIQPFLQNNIPLNIDKNSLSLNPRLRFLKYQPKDFFLRHRDGSHVSPSGAVSKYTLQIWLTDASEYHGGQTAFWFGKGREREMVEVVGKVGMAVVFEQEVLHEGREVEIGCKFVVRTDIMVGDCV